MTTRKWGTRITNDGETLLVFWIDNKEAASINADTYDDEYVVLFGDGKAEVDFERMQMFGSIAAAINYVMDELGQETSDDQDL
jgi:hypothetical protein